MLEFLGGSLVKRWKHEDLISGDFLLARRRADGHHPSVCIMKEKL
jgi:hypothetical protein